MWVWGGWIHHNIKLQYKEYCAWKAGPSIYYKWDDINDWCTKQHIIRRLDSSSYLSGSVLIEYEPYWRLVDWGFEVKKIQDCLRSPRYGSSLSDDDVDAFAAAWLAKYKDYVYDFINDKIPFSYVVERDAEIKKAVEGRLNNEEMEY